MVSKVQYTKNLSYLIHLMSIRSRNQEQDIVAHFAVENTAAEFVGENLKNKTLCAALFTDHRSVRSTQIRSTYLHDNIIRQELIFAKHFKQPGEIVGQWCNVFEYTVDVTDLGFTY